MSTRTFGKLQFACAMDRNPDKYLFAASDGVPSKSRYLCRPHFQRDLNLNVQTVSYAVILPPIHVARNFDGAGHQITA